MEARCGRLRGKSIRQKHDRPGAGLGEGREPSIGPRGRLPRDGQGRNAWEHWEAQLARGLLDDISGQLRPLTTEQRQRETELVGKLQAFDEQIGRLVARSARVKMTTNGSRSSDSPRA